MAHNRNRTLFSQTDLFYGVAAKWVKFVPLFFISLFFCIPFYNSFRFLATVTEFDVNPTMMDYIIRIFNGIEPYIPEPSKPFEVPFLWAIPNFYVAFMVANYPTNDLFGFGKHMVLQSKSRVKWYLGKCLWTACTVLGCYLMVYLPPVILSAFTGTLSLRVTDAEVMAGSLMADYAAADPALLAFHVLLLPFLTSLALSFIQLFLEFLWKPIFGITAVICILIASAYYTTPFLPSNFSILLRSAYALEGGMSFGLGLTVSLALILSFAGIGAFYFNRYDILDKS